MADDPIVAEEGQQTEYDYVGNVRLLIGDAQEEVPTALLELLVQDAMDLVLTRRHPFSDDPTGEAWEPRFDSLACHVAAFMWEKMGAEGQTASRENGIYRAWDQSDAYVPAGLLSRVVPIAAVP